MSQSAWSMPLSAEDRKSTRLNSSHLVSSYAVFCLNNKSVLVEPRDRAPSPGHRRAGPAFSFHVAGKALDNRPAGMEQVQAVLLAPFFFKDTATTEIYTLSLHDALPI